MVNYFISYKGRIDRLTYWISQVMFYVLLYLLVTFMPADTGNDLNLSLLILIMPLWFSFVITIKRLHDMNCSGWWILINFIPYIGPIIMLIVLGFVPGTKGSNRFGDAAWA
jgi:uncharacterized membrane protein YhaH (DUF805 family)